MFISINRKPNWILNYSQMQTSDSNKEANGISLRVTTIVLDEHT